MWRWRNLFLSMLVLYGLAACGDRYLPPGKTVGGSECRVVSTVFGGYKLEGDCRLEDLKPGQTILLPVYDSGGFTGTMMNWGREGTCTIQSVPVPCNDGWGVPPVGWGGAGAYNGWGPGRGWQVFIQGTTGRRY